jgi:hypothetical protein
MNAFNQLKIDFSMFGDGSRALCIRTLPNQDSKHSRDYTKDRACFLSVEAATHISEQWRITHTLVDLPSVDRDSDGGKLLAHRALLDLPTEGSISADEALKSHRTITELSFFPDSLPDGLYMLQLHVPNIETDAVPSRPILFPVHLQTDRNRS